MTPVTLTRMIPTHCLDYPAGTRFFAVWQGDELANLVDANGAIRISCAEFGSFDVVSDSGQEEFTTEARRHGEEQCQKNQNLTSMTTSISGTKATPTSNDATIAVEMGTGSSEQIGTAPTESTDHITERSSGAPAATDQGEPRTAHSGDFFEPSSLRVSNSQLEESHTKSLRHEECPFEPASVDTANAELSSIAHREPQPSVTREESIRLARLKIRVLDCDARNVSPHVRERLREYGYELRGNEFTTEARRRGAEEKLRRSSEEVHESALTEFSDTGLVASESETVCVLDSRTQGSGESFGWSDTLPAYLPDQIGWKLIGTRIARVFKCK